MATESERIIEHLRRLTRHDAGAGDGRLLERFTLHKDEAAFETLVRRHGPMVLGVCRRILGNHHDAEDAFQATFLVLVRKSASVTPKETVASWLYGVALRTALKAKAHAAKVRAREQRAAQSDAAPVGPHDFPGELQAVLDQELNRLSEKHRAAFVLCVLEGRTHQEAARQLGCPEGTLSVRLMRAKNLLAKRLSGRGFGPSAGSLPVLASADAMSASVPPSLMAATVKAAAAFAAGQAATGLISANVAILTHGVLKTMLLTKIKVASVLILVAGIAGLGMRPLAEILRAGGNDGKPSVVEQSPKAKVIPPIEQKKDDRTTDWDRIQGSWQVIKLEVEGKSAPEEVVKNGQYVFKGNELSVFQRGKSRWHATFTLDPAKSPKTFDLTVLDGTEKGKTMYGIYRIEAETLFLCIGEKRPTDFSGAGEAALMHLKRTDDDAPLKQKVRDDSSKEQKPPPAAPNATVRRLMNERVDALRKYVDALEKEAEVGKVAAPMLLFDAWRQLVAAELELSDTNAERQACLTRALARVRPFKERYEQMFQAGTIGPHSYFGIAAFYLELEIAYEREKAAATK